MHKIVTVLNAMELFTLKGFTSYYVNYPSLKNTRKYVIQIFNRKKNSFESVLMRWMKLEPIIQSEVSQKDKDHYNILTHIYGI